MPRLRPANFNRTRLARCAAALLWPLAAALTMPVSAMEPPGKAPLKAETKGPQVKPQPKSEAPSRKDGRKSRSKRLTRKERQALEREAVGPQPAMAPPAWPKLEDANQLAATYVPKNERGQSMAAVFPVLGLPTARALREKADQLFRQHAERSDIRSIEPTLRQAVEGIAKCHLMRATLAHFRTQMVQMASVIEGLSGQAGGAGRGGPVQAEAAMGGSVARNAKQLVSDAEEMIAHTRRMEGVIVLNLDAYGQKRWPGPATALNPVQAFIRNLQSAYISEPTAESGPAPGEAKAPAPAVSGTPTQAVTLPAPVAGADAVRRYPALADVFMTCADGSLLEMDDDAAKYPSEEALTREYRRLERYHLTRHRVKYSPGLECVLHRLAYLHEIRKWFKDTRRERKEHPERFAPEDTLRRFDRVIATTIAIEADYIKLLKWSLAQYVKEHWSAAPEDDQIPNEVAGWLRFVESLRAVQLPAKPEQPYWREPMIHGWPLLPPWVKDEAEAAAWVERLNAKVMTEPGFTDEVLEDRIPEPSLPPPPPPAAETDPA
jgi:hypothetical protein